jgi:hypothetical protein
VSHFHLLITIIFHATKLKLFSETGNDHDFLLGEIEKFEIRRGTLQQSDGDRWYGNEIINLGTTANQWSHKFIYFR